LWTNKSVLNSMGTNSLETKHTCTISEMYSMWGPRPRKRWIRRRGKQSIKQNGENPPRATASGDQLGKVLAYSVIILDLKEGE
jgi:hypothetical protein